MREPGRGLELQLAVNRLRRLHGISIGFEHLNLIPMAGQTDGPMILAGIASTSAIDQQRMSIRPYCLSLPRRVSSLPLLFKHRADVVAGSIDELGYDDKGILRIRCTVTHELARRCNAFSIACTVHAYEIVNAERRDFFGLITHATCDEVSLTDIPANQHALVTGRYPVSPRVEYYDLMLARVVCLQRMTKLLQQEIRT